MRDDFKKVEEVNEVENVEEKKKPIFSRPEKENNKQEMIKKQYVVKPPRLNVRREPSEGSPIVSTVIEGDVLTVQESSSINPSWKKVSDPVNGYVLAAFLDAKR